MKKALVEYIKPCKCQQAGKKRWMLYEMAEKRRKAGIVKILKVENA
jgi:hypothetical protein